jgi:hypothetical protein
VTPTQQAFRAYERHQCEMCSRRVLQSDPRCSEGQRLFEQWEAACNGSAPQGEMFVEGK